MLRTILIIASLCFSLSTQEHAVEKANYTQEEVTHESNPFTVAVDSYLYMITQNRMHINVTIAAYHSPSCVLALDPFEDAIFGRIRASISADFSKIVVWGVLGAEPEDGDSKKVYYTILVINMNSCGYRRASIPGELFRTSQPIVLPQVIMYKDMFDVFFYTQAECSPCTFEYYEARRKFAFDRVLFSEEPSRRTKPDSGRFFIRTLESYNNSQHGYFYVYNFDESRATLKYLNYDFISFTERTVDYQIDAVSTNIGRMRNVGICYQSTNDSSLNCDRLNSKLWTVNSIRLPVNQRVSNISFEYDGNGRSYIAVVESKKIRVFIYTWDGQLSDNLDFGTIDANSNYWEIYGYLVNDEYCVITIEFQTIDATEALHSIKCIDKKWYMDRPKPMDK